MNFKSLLNKCIHEDIKNDIETLNNLQEDKLENIILNNSANANKLIKITKMNINTDLYNDLEMFTDYKGNDKTILTKINNTSTDGGNHYLKNLLENPSDNYEFLNEKKKSMKNLFNILEVEEVNIKKNLVQLSDTERSLFWIFKSNNVEQDNLINILYFNNYFLKYLNNSSHILTGVNLYKIFISPFIGILSPIRSIIFLRFLYSGLKSCPHSLMQ